MDFIQKLWLGWKADEEGKTIFYPMHKINVNPFKNYKTALKFLKREINKKTMLSNYEPTDTDWALMALFKSKKFMKHGKRTA